jgi:tectonin beta-propeller repeat-containing protein 1
VRWGITHDTPEGTEWANVPTLENGQEVTSISVGPTGLVWAITYDGHALVRIGTNWETPLGE